MFFENFKIISCYALAIITAIGAIYFGINGIKIITASDNFTIYTNDYPYHHPVNDNIEKTELLVFPLIFAFIFIISTITLFHMAIKCVDHKKDLIKKLENMKKRNAIDAKHKSK
jgi:nitric oxide reductase large subunit